MHDESPPPGPSGGTPRLKHPGGSPRTEVFVLGGIHESHEGARFYTYERLGELFTRLAPDLLCVEVLQQHLDDGTDTGMPRDFRLHMVPQARAAGIPVVGIDWWHEQGGAEWRELQRQAGCDPALAPEVELLGTLFNGLNRYFQQRDFRRIHAPETIQLWQAKSALKHALLEQHPAYSPIVRFEQERNRQMVARILDALERYPVSRVLVAVGLDHKGPIEQGLAARGVSVLAVDPMLESWAGGMDA